MECVVLFSLWGVAIVGRLNENEMRVLGIFWTRLMPRKERFPEINLPFFAS